MDKPGITVKFFNTLQILSIDIVLGSIAVGYLAIRLLNVIPEPSWWIILPSSVWVVYSIDHLLDGFKNKNTALIKRHLYFYKYRVPLIMVIGFVSIYTVILVLIYLSYPILISGITLGAIVILYFIIVNFGKEKLKKIIPKETIIAFIYVSGIFFAPIYWYGQIPDFFEIIVISIIFLLAFAEGVMASYFEYDLDLSDKHNSFTISLSPIKTRRVMITLHLSVELILMVLLFYQLSFLHLSIILILLLMNFILGIIILFPNNIFISKYYRVMGEGVFLLPALLLFIN